MSRLPAWRRARLDIGRTYQTSIPFGGLTVRQNLYVAVRGVAGGRFSFRRPSARDADMRLVAEMAERGRIAHLLDLQAGALAHGQRRQLEIAMALAQRPRVLMLDEPAGGPSPLRTAGAGPAARRPAGGHHLVIIEHDMDVALAVGWTVERVYQTFPRLAERRRNGGTQLSGGEQQMLAIGRALLTEPKLLVLDEPSEGLGPVILEHLCKVLVELAGSGLRILLVGQKLGIAASVCQRAAVMVNGRIATAVAIADLARDEDLQMRYFGIAPHGPTHRRT